MSPERPSLSWDDPDEADYHKQGSDAPTLVIVDRDDLNTGDEADGWCPHDALRTALRSPDDTVSRQLPWPPSVMP